VNEEERLLRLFVMVPKSMPQKELEEVFSQYGDIDYVSIVKDHETKASKGFAYIKYHRSVPLTLNFKSRLSSVNLI
jgi:RNA recognition motif. (a.k.a. RRM, RBD, or RNP domain)